MSTAQAACARTDHRPWPLPQRRWALSMVWHDFLFLHWPLDPAALRRVLPRGLEPDTFEGRAWLGVVPFRMSGVAPRGIPGLPWLSAFPEINLRTYVRAGDRSGVWFLSLDIPRLPAVLVARALWRLPYYWARMRFAEEGGWIRYACTRRGRRGPPACFEGRYREAEGPAPDDAFARWLTERYALFSCGRDGRVLRGDVQHPPWPLRPAEFEVERCTLAEPAGLPLDGPPHHALFARRLDVVVWRPVPEDGGDPPSRRDGGGPP